MDWAELNCDAVVNRAHDSLGAWSQISQWRISHPIKWQKWAEATNATMTFPNSASSLTSLNKSCFKLPRLGGGYHEMGKLYGIQNVPVSKHHLTQTLSQVNSNSNFGLWAPKNGGRLNLRVTMRSNCCVKYFFEFRSCCRWSSFSKCAPLATPRDDIQTATSKPNHITCLSRIEPSCWMHLRLSQWSRVLL